MSPVSPHPVPLSGEPGPLPPPQRAALAVCKHAINGKRTLNCLRLRFASRCCVPHASDPTQRARACVCGGTGGGAAGPPHGARPRDPPGGAARPC